MDFLTNFAYIISGGFPMADALTFEKVWAALMENREQMKETDKKIGELGNRFGELAEHLVRPGIVDKFNAIGFNFSEVSQEREFKDPKTKKHLAEVDIYLENGDIVIAVEVKAKLKKQDIDNHIERMKVLRRIAESKGDNRKYRGAVAGAIMTSETLNYAHDSGFYVIEQSGDTMKLDLPEGFVPRDW